MIQRQKKDHIYVLASAAMVLPAAFLFFVVSDLPHIFIITLIGFILSLSISPTIKYSDRSIIYSVLIALILAVVFNMIFPMKQERFFSIAKLFMSQVTVPLILYLAAIATFYESTPYTLGFNSAFSIIVIMLAGDFSQNIQMNDNSLFAFLIEGEKFKTFFLTVAVTNALAMLFAFTLAQKSLFHKKIKGHEWFKKAVTATAILAASLIAAGLFTLLNTYRNDIRKLEQYLGSFRRFRHFGGSRVLFGREIDLNRTINSDLRKNSKQIMIRVVGKTPPGYLRGRAYQFYNNGKWRESLDIAESMKFKINVENLAINAFFFEKDPGRAGEKFEIFTTTDCITSYLFYPGNTQRFELVADRLSYTKNGNLTPKSWEKDGGYTTYVANIDQTSPFHGPVDIPMMDYLQIPKDLAETVNNTANKIAINFPKTSFEQTDRKITDLVISYFYDNYKYTLDPEGPEKDIDPVEHFITKTQKGHCELFATSAVLLLRHFGIPSRYVTGFICDESHPSNQYYVARLGNAHAWCEAYLRDEKRWVLIEPTPPGGINPYGNEWGIFEVWLDRFRQSAQKMFADVRRGYIARAILAFIVDITVFLWEILWHPLRGTIIIASTVFLIWFLKYYRIRKQSLILQLDKEILLIKKDFDSLTAFITRKTGIKRNPSETISEWKSKLKNSKLFIKEQEIFANFAKIISDYQQLRFSASSLKNSEISNLKKSIHSFKKNL